MDDVSLSDVIGEISNQLLISEAQRIQEGRPALFLADSVDIELSFVVTRSKEGSAGLDLRVVRAEGTKHYDEQEVQRVTVHLVGAVVPESQRSGEASDEFQPISRAGLMPVRPRRRFDE